MEVHICSRPEDVAEIGADIVASVCRSVGEAPVLGVATGSSPLGLYAELARLVEGGELDLSKASAFALDEYVGLPPGHPQSYAEVIRRTVTAPLQMDPAHVHTPNGLADDLESAAAEYDALIADSGGVDIQILGVGTNGHIGFNEPTSSLTSRTRIKTLTTGTREDNARFFDSPHDVPAHCLTQGLGTIMDARQIVLVAQGSSKAEAVAALVEGPVTARLPGSILQMHPRVTVVVDTAAASRLSLQEYYTQVQMMKPQEGIGRSVPQAQRALQTVEG